MLTLDQALDAIAQRSFYEDATVTPVEGGYTVEDDPGYGLTENWIWTYGGGLHERAGVSETSRLHEPYEFYTDAEHIRYNLPAAVEALEAGHAVTFGYGAVDDGDVSFDIDGNPVDENGDSVDGCVGWIMAAIIHDRD